MTSAEEPTCFSIFFIMSIEISTLFLPLVALSELSVATCDICRAVSLSPSILSVISLNRSSRALIVCSCSKVPLVKTSILAATVVIASLARSVLSVNFLPADMIRSELSEIFVSKPLSFIFISLTLSANDPNSSRVMIRKSGVRKFPAAIFFMFSAMSLICFI